MMLPPDNFRDDSLTPATCNPQLGSGALPCDGWHHYYHYQSSDMYLWLAETCRMLGREEEAQKAYARALFQDHFNDEALAGQKRTGGQGREPAYAKHPALDSLFLASVGKTPGPSSQLHDKAVALMEKGGQQAEDLLNEAIEANPACSNHFLARGKFRYRRGNHEAARADLLEAIRLSHAEHDAYHRVASEEHLARGRHFAGRGELDLAINDFTKALDLHRGNRKALEARAEAYRAKGALPLAREDEEKASRL